MLNCKQFVEQSLQIIENEKLSFWQHINNRLHLFLCVHCRKYLKQAQITATVAKNIESEPLPDQLIEKCVRDMKQLDSTGQTPQK